MELTVSECFILKMLQVIPKDLSVRVRSSVETLTSVKFVSIKFLLLRAGMSRNECIVCQLST